MQDATNFICKKIDEELKLENESGLMLSQRSTLLLSFLIPASVYFFDKNITLLVICYMIIAIILTLKCWLPIEIGKNTPFNLTKFMKQNDNNVREAFAIITENMLNSAKNKNTKRHKWLLYCTILTVICPFVYYLYYLVVESSYFAYNHLGTSL